MPWRRGSSCGGCCHFGSQRSLACLVVQCRSSLPKQAVLVQPCYLLRGEGMLSLARPCFLAVLFCLALGQCFAEQVNYAEVRSRVSNAFGEKVHEMSETLAVLQDLSKETSALLASIKAQCSHRG